MGFCQQPLPLTNVAVIMSIIVIQPFSAVAVYSLLLPVRERNCKVTLCEICGAGPIILINC